MNQDDLTPIEGDAYEERAGIMEYDANLSRYEAERRAMKAVMDRRKLV